MINLEAISRLTLKKLRREFWVLCAFSCAIGLLFLTGPLYMMQVYDRVLNSQSIPTLLGLTLLIVVLYAAMGVLEWVRNCLFSMAASRVEEDLSDPALDAMFDARIKSSGSDSSTTLGDLQTVRRFLSSPIMSAVFDAPWSFVFLLVLFLLHWAYGMLALVGGLVLVIISLLNQKMMAEPLKKAEMEGRDAQMHAAETSNEIAAAQALGMRGERSKVWRTKLDIGDKSMREASNLLGIFTASAKTFRLMLQSGILGLGAWLVIFEHSTPGTMIAASILMGRVIAPLEQMTSQWRTISAAMASWKSLGDMVSREENSPQPPMKLPPISGKLSFERVTAGPDQQPKPVLKVVSFDVEAGDCLAIIGPSASGKTTIAQVIMGLLLPRAGVVRLNNANRENYNVDVLGKQIGYLPQDIGLFSGSIQENISRFTPDTSPEQVINAAQAADCHEFILQLPNGYDTQIGVGGAYLSGGQRQRIGLARAMFGDPKLVVLDEPNSNLDGDGEAALQRAISAMLDRGATVVMIVHRQSALRHCNKMLVLENGQVQHFGAKEAVLSQLMPAKKS